MANPVCKSGHGFDPASPRRRIGSRQPGLTSLACTSDAARSPGISNKPGTVARNSECEAYRVGGVTDHVHLALRLSRTLTIAKLVETLKTASSKWLKSQSASLGAFAWQRGYGCFSVGPADLPALCEYIAEQERHHQRRTFQEELRMFLDKYGVEYDEAYVWV